MAQGDGEEEAVLGKTKPLYGMYHQQIEVMADIRKSYQWLDKADQHLIMAAPEQALRRSIEAGIYHSRGDPRCRLCKDDPGTVQHLDAECKMLAGTANAEKHNKVTGMVYRNISAGSPSLDGRRNWK